MNDHINVFSAPLPEGRPVTSYREEAVLRFQNKIGAPTDLSISDMPGFGDDQLFRAAATLSELSKSAKELYKQDRRDERLMRAQLMLEELAEVLRGMASMDEEATLDGLADLAYVTEGTATTFGLPLGWAFDEVHESNMTKGAVSHADGIKGKGDGYQPPRLRRLINKFQVLQAVSAVNKE